MPVRDAVASDVPIVRALQSLLPEPVDDLFADGLPSGITLVAVPDSARAGPDATSGGVVTTTGGHPVGYVHAYDTGYVAELVVAPAHRGRGHGRALLARALAALRSRGVDTAELEVAADNDRARSLYESLGFTVVERRPDRYASGDGLRMNRSLDDPST
jgi:ribosomal-protein-alanine N-acetyltransferase